MSDKKSTAAARAAFREPGEIISSNIRRLIEQNRTTQKALAEELGIAAASMSDYCKGRRIPNVEFFILLKERYGISIDDFLTKQLPESGTPSVSKETDADRGLMAAYRKYCGSYFTYYFDTSKYRGRDTQEPHESLMYGVLILYEKPSAGSRPDFGSAAVLGVRDRKQVTIIKKTLDGLRAAPETLEYIGEHYPGTAYYGDFELTREHAFIRMSHADTDRAFLILHRVDNNKPDYTGGIGTVNSVSKGRERMPVVQFMGISRHPLAMSAEEIHHSLLLSYPEFQTDAEAEGMIRSFKELYISPEERVRDFSEYQKSIIVRSTLERYIKKNIERNVFRYGKISERDDDDWYHTIKAASAED